jgi:hypothetical protein
MSRASPLVAPLVLAACASAVRPLELPYHPQAPVDGGRPHEVVSIHDSAFASVGVPPLAAVTLPDGYREFRISTGHGMVYGGEYPLLRLVATPSTIAGEIYYYRGLMPAEVPPHGNRWQLRRGTPRDSVSWTQVLARFDSLGIEELTAPRYATAMMDAGELIVEFRHGPFYRAYGFNAPHYRDDDVSRRAATIAATVYSLTRRASP